VTAPAAAVSGRATEIFLVAGEKSGDELGYKLMRALREATGGKVILRGVGGEAMEREGLTSLFPQSDIAVMGFLPVIARLPTLLRRIRETAAAVIANPPDVLVIIDSPDFTHRVAKRVRKALPHLPIVDYVSPTVWAWRPGRARAMRAYVDHLLALLPFEPEVHARLGGPQTTYVGHPLIERLDEFRPSPDEQRLRDGTPPTILILPGSRRSEIERLTPVFGDAVARLAAKQGPLDFVIPAVAHVEQRLREAVAHWQVQPRIVMGEAEKLASFRRARAALAASGTVTLELALAGVPMVVGYRVSKIEERIIRALATAPSFILPNLILGENAIPGFLQEACDGTTLAAHLAPLIAGGAERDAQLAAFKRLDTLMRLPEGASPSARAAQIVLGEAYRARG
jgi:lipid-A-disaccharide synthase